MMLDDLLSNVPTEIWTEILSYLMPHERRSFQLTCTLLRKAATDPFVDIAWMPLLNRLKVIDPQISLLPPPQVSNFWRRDRFKEAFEKIMARQREEITHFHDFFFQKANNYPFVALIYGSSEKAIEAVTKIGEMHKDFKKTLCHLEERDIFLNTINENMIEAKISKNHRFENFLDLHDIVRELHPEFSSSPKGSRAPKKVLTRFPQSVILRDRQGFWKNCQWIRLNRHKIQVLPDFRRCEKLHHLNCEDNQIEVLPETLCEMDNLRELLCERNDIKNPPMCFQEKFGEPWYRRLCLESTREMRQGLSLKRKKGNEENQNTSNQLEKKPRLISFLGNFTFKDGFPYQKSNGKKEESESESDEENENGSTLQRKKWF